MTWLEFSCEIIRHWCFEYAIHYQNPAICVFMLTLLANILEKKSIFDVIKCLVFSAKWHQEATFRLQAKLTQISFFLLCL